MNQNVNRRIREILDEANNIADRNLEDFLATVNRMREEVVLVIVQGGELDPLTVRMVQDRLRDIQRTYQERFSDLMSENQRRIFIKGIQVVDKAVEAGNILKAVPYLSEETLRQAQAFSATLVTNLTQQAVQEISMQLDLAVLAQRPAIQVIKEIGTNLQDASVFGTIRRRAEIIYRTEVNRIQSLATIERMEQLSLTIPDLKKEWRHSHVGLPRPGHLALHGKVVGVKENFILEGRYDTYPVYGPFDPQLPAEETINCRCKIIPVIGRFQTQKSAA
jgi:uncharacterized protein with gpF-like domain